MSRRVIRYPTGWTLAVLPDAAAADAVAGELSALGVAADDLVVLAGADAASRLERLGTSAGVAARVRRTVQFMTMDQLPDLHVYELALAREHPVIAVRVSDADARRRAVEALRGHGGHFINRFGAWATEEIAPWRGEPLPVGQLMQR
ncbi:MAG TPA: hypothetical protein VFV59_01820 [Candidatus Limnocylindria bacterium]|nr:hypothetical protein [Candidatus Limnocylindria bacterium]